MRVQSRRVALGAAAIAVVLAFGLTTAHAQNKCLAGKTKCVKKKVAGLLKCNEKCQKDPAKCGGVQAACEDKVKAKFEGGTKGEAYSCFGKLELENDGPCVTTGDLGTMEAEADAFVADTVARLEGSPPPGCGNGVVEVAESCDGADLGGATCASLGFLSGTLACTAGCGYDVSGCDCGSPAFPATGQTTCWDSRGRVDPCAGTGHDGDIQAGAPLAYQDNGDGTITDLNTGLMWEKKSDDGSINDKDTTYTWDNAFAVHVAGLNSGGGFAGYTDWRVPNYKELVSILNLENANPSVSPAFKNNCTPGCTVLTCSCTISHSSSSYWSSTTNALYPDLVWIVGFESGEVRTDMKYYTTQHYLRGVRGGS